MLRSASPAESRVHKLNMPHLNGDVNDLKLSPLPRVGSEFSFHEWKKEREQEIRERKSITLFRHPLLTVKYFSLQLWNNVYYYLCNLIKSWRTILLLGVLFSVLICFHYVKGPHEFFFKYAEQKVVWWLYWVGLGILSSVGLGSGLHTFVLYLGPHIASVTMAAFECHSVDFPEPPYPDKIVCPEMIDTSVVISIWQIVSKVRVESLMWGAGTAIGELPPYFMAKSASLTGQDPDDEDFDDFALVRHDSECHSESMSKWERLKYNFHQTIKKYGFFAILVCASIPNPLFDIAGMTCGFLLVPFWTFFGATVIGKALIKMHIQMMFVIFTFSKEHLEWLLSWLDNVPYYGDSLRKPFETFMEQKRAGLHGKIASGSDNWIQWCLNMFVTLCILYFVVTIINSMAQGYHKRLWQRRRQERNSLKKPINGTLLEENFDIVNNDSPIIKKTDYHTKQHQEQHRPSGSINEKGLTLLSVVVN